MQKLLNVYLDRDNQVVIDEDGVHTSGIQAIKTAARYICSDIGWVYKYTLVIAPMGTQMIDLANDIQRVYMRDHYDYRMGGHTNNPAADSDESAWNRAAQYAAEHTGAGHA